MHMRVTYLNHSGFFIEGESHCLLFDYYQGELPEVPAGKSLTIFASHHHEDHYSPEIFKYGERTPGTRYLLGCDITLNAANRQKVGITDEILARCDRMHKDDVFVRNGITVRALRSTDMGVAFLAEFEGKRIYHAGDHNLWIWHEDATFDRSQIAKFYEEIEKLRGIAIDAAFLPLDPRLGAEYWRGFDAFARLIEPMRMFPMHMIEDYDIIRRFLAEDCTWPYRKRVMQIHADGDAFEI